MEIYLTIICIFLFPDAVLQIGKYLHCSVPLEYASFLKPRMVVFTAMLYFSQRKILGLIRDNSTILSLFSGMWAAVPSFIHYIPIWCDPTKLQGFLLHCPRRRTPEGSLRKQLLYELQLEEYYARG